MTRWPSIRRSLPLPPPLPVPPSAQLRLVAAEQEHPRLHVWRELPGRWCWELAGPDGDILDDGTRGTWAEVVALGLAALEVASLTGSAA